MYCALIITGLFTTSSSWYGQSSTILKLDANNSSAAAPISISGPRLSYGWFDLGLTGGNGFFNPIARPDSSSSPDKISRSASTGSDTNFYRFSIPWSESQVQIPKRFYLGLGKHQGLGAWVDLGSGLTDSYLDDTSTTDSGVNS